MLVEAAIGDGYGFGRECSDKEFCDKYNNLQYITQKEDPCHMFKPGVFSDDTQMMTAICEAMVSGEDWTPLNLAKRFVDCFKRDPRRGYAGRFYHFLQDVRDGEEFLAKIQPDSERSGAAMRSMPLGLLQNIDDIRWKNKIQAELTHKTDVGVNSSFTSALMTHYFYYNKGPKQELRDWLKGITNCSLDVWTPGARVRVHGWDVVESAIHAIETGGSMGEVLKNCISYSGDVDTIATIAMAAASWAKDVDQDLPVHLYDGLENGSYGREYLVNLESQLLSCVGRRNGR